MGKEKKEQPKKGKDRYFKSTRFANPTLAPDKKPTSMKVGRNLEEEQMIAALEEWELFKEARPVLHAALREKNVKKAMREAEHIAALRLISLMQNANSEAVQLNAAKELLHIQGHKPVEKQAILGMQVNDMTDQELDARIAALAGEVMDEEEADEGDVAEAPDGAEAGLAGGISSEEG